MLRYIVTLMLYEVKGDEIFISCKLDQCAFEYVSTKPKLFFVGLWHWCGAFTSALGLLEVRVRARDVFQLLLRPVCFTAKVQGKELKC